MVSYGLPVAGEKRGGIEHVAHDLANGLARCGHEVLVWTYDPKPEFAAYEVRQLPGKRFYQTWLGQRIIMGYLGNLILLLPTYGNSDVILAHGDSLLLQLKGVPVVRVMHGSALGEALSAHTPWRCVMQLGIYLQEWLTSLLCPNCVANSYSTKRYYSFIRRVIPLGIDLNMFKPDPGSKTRDPSILFVGALNGRKRGRLLVEWFSREIRAVHPHAMLWMVVSQGPPAQGVTYFTGISQEDLATLYRRAWVYASPSTYEGFGLPYIEALASGTPVVATPNPGSKEILEDGRFGLLVRDSEFCGKICDLLSNAAWRDAMADNGLRRAQFYSLDNMVHSYETFLLDLCPRGTYSNTC
jgi:glycosyltransferase involved in cell wall biosynthesis